MTTARTARIALGLAAAAALVAAIAFLPLARWAPALIEWVRGAGPGGVAVYGAAYLVATLLMLPGSALAVGAGFLYGPIAGTLLVSPVSVLAATVAFLLGRSVARQRVARRIGQGTRLAAIDEAIGRGGLKLVLLLRLSPVFPFNLLNYALGLTRVRLRDYVLASFLGMLPGTFLYVYLGSLVTSATEIMSGKRPDAGVWGQALYWGGLGATIVATALIARRARGALERELDGPAPSLPAGVEARR